MAQPSLVAEHGTLHIPDINERNDLQAGTVSGSRTFLFVPFARKANSLEH